MTGASVDAVDTDVGRPVKAPGTYSIQVEQYSLFKFLDLLFTL